MDSHGKVKGKTEEKPPKEEEDPLERSLGQFGWWQFWVTLFLSLFNIPCTFHIFAPTFISAQPDDFWCARPPALAAVPLAHWKNLSSVFTHSSDGSSYDPCRIKALDYESIHNLSELIEASRETTTTKNCDKWEYNTTLSGPTTITQWNLVCNNKDWANVAEMLFLFGVAVGGLTGSLSDKFGRKKLQIYCLVLQTILGMLIVFVPWFSVYLVLRTLLGFVCVSLVFTGFVLCMELVGGKWLTISGVSYLIPVSLGYILIAGIAYLIRGWRYLQLAITLPSLVLLSLCWLLPESPRWLLAMGKSEKALAVIERAAKFNKKTLPPDTSDIIHEVCIKKEKDENGSKMKGSISSLLISSRLRKITLVLCVVWFTNYFLYYGLVLNLSHLGGNVYINSVISGGVELPAVAASILVLLKMGRKWPICLTLLLSGICCLVTSFLPPGQIGLGLAMAAKLCVSSTNVMLPVFTAELFPTLVRNLGIGVCNIASGVSLLFIPYLWNMAPMAGVSTPMCMLGLGGVVGGFLVLLLPETKTLADSIEPSQS